MYPIFLLKNVQAEYYSIVKNVYFKFNHVIKMKQADSLLMEISKKYKL